MKYLIYLIATFLMLIWGFLFWGFDVIPIVHILPVIAVAIVIARILFDKKLSNKTQVEKPG